MKNEKHSRIWNKQAETTKLCPSYLEGRRICEDGFILEWGKNP